jgi:hypothetical protein
VLGDLWVSGEGVGTGGDTGSGGVSVSVGLGGAAAAAKAEEGGGLSVVGAGSGGVDHDDGGGRGRGGGEVDGGGLDSGVSERSGGEGSSLMLAAVYVGSTAWSTVPVLCTGGAMRVAMVLVMRVALLFMLLTLLLTVDVSHAMRPLLGGSCGGVKPRESTLLCRGPSVSVGHQAGTTLPFRLERTRTARYGI